MTIRVVLEFRTDEWSLEESEKLRLQLRNAVRNHEDGNMLSVITKDTIERID